MAVFNSAADGWWSAATTWGGAGVPLPLNGDTANISHVVWSRVGDTIGCLNININPNSTFRLKGGSVLMDNGGKITLNAGTSKVKTTSTCTSALITCLVGSWEFDGAGGGDIDTDTELVFENVYMDDTANIRGTGTLVYKGNNTIYGNLDSIEQVSFEIRRATVKIDDTGNVQMDGTTKLYLNGTSSTPAVLTTYGTATPTYFTIDIQSTGKFKGQYFEVSYFDTLKMNGTFTASNGSFIYFNTDPIFSSDSKLDITYTYWRHKGDTSWHFRGSPPDRLNERYNEYYNIDWCLYNKTSSSFIFPEPGILLDRLKQPNISETQVLGRDSGRVTHSGNKAEKIKMDGVFYGSANKWKVEELSELAETGSTFVFQWPKGFRVVMIDAPRSPLVGGREEVRFYTLNMVECV